MGGQAHAATSAPRPTVSEPAHLLVLGTYRDTDVGRSHPLTEVLADLRPSPGVERLRMSGLDAAGVAAFIEHVAGRDLDDAAADFAREVWSETQGNPFFVSEVVRHLAELGALQQDGHWVIDGSLDELGVPEGVREVVGRRLSRLSESANKVLRVAAVAGPEFEPAVVAESAGMAEDELLGALDEAVAARLVLGVSGLVSGYRFAHALVRGALYDELTVARRSALHRRVAEAIERIHDSELGGYLPALAHHWARAAEHTHERAKAVDYATRAGDQAMAQLAHDEAAAYYQQALDLLGARQDRRRVALLIALGEAQRAGGLAFRETLLEAARSAAACGDTDGLVRAALANTRTLISAQAGVVDGERIEILELALQAIGEADSTERARLLVTLAVELFWSGQRRSIELTQQARAMAHRLDDPAVLTEVAIKRYMPSPAAEIEERLADSVMALRHAEQSGDPVQIAQALTVRARCLSEVGNIAEAVRCIERATTLASELRQPVLSWYIGLTVSGLELFSGNIAAAKHAIEETLALGRAGGALDADTWYLTHQFQLRYDIGGLEAIEMPFRDLVAAVPGMEFNRPTLLVLLCELGQFTEASAILDSLAANRFAHFSENVSWLRSMTMCATGAAYLDDADSAAMLHERLVPFASVFPVTALLVTGCGSHFLGMLCATLRRWSDAEAHFGAAEAAHDRAGSPTWLARTRLEWARMYVRRNEPGDDAQAHRLIEQARATAAELSLGGILSHVNALASRREDRGAS